MSTGGNTSLPSAHNIARYTQAISSNLGNLMSELARASAPAPVDNEAIMNQLRIITEQLTTVNHRLNALELASYRSLDRTAQRVVPAELSQDLNPLLLPTPAYEPWYLSLMISADGTPDTVRTMPERSCTTPRPDSAATRFSPCATTKTKRSSDSRQPSGISRT